MPSYDWYQQLTKPAWAPPAFLFGPVWSILYVMIAISFGTVFWLTLKKRLPTGIFLPFVLNLLLNLSFTPIQFGLKNNYLALVDILAVLITLLWAMKSIYKYRKWIAVVLAPYLVWVIFATGLQIAITWMNR
jgi:tryptophan-rich sensory protein